MSFIFGGVRGREDPELAAGNRRTRLHYARDLNDQRALPDDRPADPARPELDLAGRGGRRPGRPRLRRQPRRARTCR